MKSRMMSVMGETMTSIDSSLMVFGENQAVIAEVREKEDIQEYLGLLLRLEADLYPPCSDYLTAMQANQSTSESDPVTEGWRRKLCEWAYEVVDHFKFDREVVFIALAYLDRFVANWMNDTNTPLPKKEYQLLAVTSIYMAIKIHGETDSIEGPRRKLRIDAFFELSRKQFDVAIIEKTERVMLEALNWHVNPPTALKFISTLLSLCPKWYGIPTTSTHMSVLGSIYDVARYLSELSVCQSAFSFSCNTSLTAYASLLCAIEASSATMPIPYEVRVQFLSNIAEATGFLAGDVEVLRVCSMLKQLCPSMFDDAESGMEDGSVDLEGEARDDGKSSPICVVEEKTPNRFAVDESRRKRSRSEDNNWRPISTNRPNRTS